MQKSEKTVKCVICQGAGTAVHLTADDDSARLQSLDCPGGLLARGSAGSLSAADTQRRPTRQALALSHQRQSRPHSYAPEVARTLFAHILPTLGGQAR
jgi:hypothetical protein